jgi:threonine/homoserine/homoserine lactone efflux protein
MSQQWLNIATFLSIYTMAIVAPGANFVMVLNTALASSRQTSLVTALGVATGSGLFALAGLFGVISMANSLPYFAVIMGAVGGGYLLYIGAGMLLNLRATVRNKSRAPVAAPRVLPLHAYRTGLVTNLTNPKAWAFYISLFTLVLVPTFPLWARIFLSGAMFLISLLWYATVALLATNHRIQPIMERILPVFQGGLGLLLIWLGGRLVWS